VSERTAAPPLGDGVHRVLTPNGEEEELHGRLLGFGTSQRTYHNHPVPRDLELHADDWKCSACRWFEVSVIALDDGAYAVYTVGRSELPYEEPRARLQFTESPFEIIEMLTDRRGPRPRLPVAAARCLAQAASHDDRVADAYVNRAVV
jgi:hypothetical protein